MMYFLYLRSPRTNERHWIVDAALHLATDATSAAAFNATEAVYLASLIPNATVHKLPCDNSMHLTEAMRRTLNLN